MSWHAIQACNTSLWIHWNRNRPLFHDIDCWHWHMMAVTLRKDEQKHRLYRWASISQCQALFNFGHDSHYCYHHSSCLFLPNKYQRIFKCTPEADAQKTKLGTVLGTKFCWCNKQWTATAISQLLWWFHRCSCYCFYRSIQHWGWTRSCTTMW